MMRAIRGVHRLTRHWIENYRLDVDEVPEAISAMLVVVVERLRASRSRGSWDDGSAHRLVPGERRHPFPRDAGEDNVRLEAWSDAKLARHHRVEWKRARTRARTRRRTKEQATAPAKDPAR